METKAFIASLALLLNSLFGGPASLHQKLRLNGVLKSPERLVATLEKKLNRDRRNPEERVLRGRIVVASCLLLALLSGIALEHVFANSLFEAILLAFLITLRPAFDRAFAVHAALAKNNEADARNALSTSGWRNYSVLDEHGLARAAIESLAVDFCDKVVAPLFWFLLLGLPGVFATKTVSILAERLRPYDNFNNGALLAERIVLQPGKIGALLLVIAACFLPFSRPTPAAMFAIATPPGAPSRLMALAVMGAALNLSLGGPTSIYSENHIWFGGTIARAGARDVNRALMLTGIATLVLLLTLFLFIY